VPVLARIVETRGIPTVTVTMNPDMAAKFHLSRIVGVEFPYGYSFGTPHNDALMLTVARTTMRALAEAKGPGYRLDVEPSEYPWPVPPEVAYKTWHPPQASPIVAEMLKRRG
jgi:hypothetical protein